MHGDHAKSIEYGNSEGYVWSEVIWPTLNYSWINATLSENGEFENASNEKTKHEQIEVHSQSTGEVNKKDHNANEREEVLTVDSSGDLDNKRKMKPPLEQPESSTITDDEEKKEVFIEESQPLMSSVNEKSSEEFFAQPQQHLEAASASEEVETARFEEAQPLTNAVFAEKKEEFLDQQQAQPLSVATGQEDEVASDRKSQFLADRKTESSEQPQWQISGVATDEDNKNTSSKKAESLVSNADKNKREESFEQSQLESLTAVSDQDSKATLIEGRQPITSAAEKEKKVETCEEPQLLSVTKTGERVMAFVGESLPTGSHTDKSQKELSPEKAQPWITLIDEIIQKVSEELKSEEPDFDRILQTEKMNFADQTTKLAVEKMQHSEERTTRVVNDQQLINGSRNSERKPESEELQKANRKKLTSPVHITDIDIGVESNDDTKNANILAKEILLEKHEPREETNKAKIVGLFDKKTISELEDFSVYKNDMGDELFKNPDQTETIADLASVPEENTTGSSYSEKTNKEPIQSSTVDQISESSYVSNTNKTGINFETEVKNFLTTIVNNVVQAAEKECSSENQSQSVSLYDIKDAKKEKMIVDSESDQVGSADYLENPEVTKMCTEGAEKSSTLIESTNLIIDGTHSPVEKSQQTDIFAESKRLADEKLESLNHTEIISPQSCTQGGLSNIRTTALEASAENQTMRALGVISFDALGNLGVDNTIPVINDVPKLMVQEEEVFGLDGDERACEANMPVIQKYALEVTEKIIAEVECFEAKLDDDTTKNEMHPETFPLAHETGEKDKNFISSQQPLDICEDVTSQKGRQEDELTKQFVEIIDETKTKADPLLSVDNSTKEVAQEVMNGSLFLENVKNSESPTSQKDEKCKKEENPRDQKESEVNDIEGEEKNLPEAVAVTNKELYAEKPESWSELLTEVSQQSQVAEKYVGDDDIRTVLPTDSDDKSKKVSTDEKQNFATLESLKNENQINKFPNGEENKWTKVLYDTPGSESDAVGFEQNLPKTLKEEEYRQEESGMSVDQSRSYDGGYELTDTESYRKSDSCVSSFSTELKQQAENCASGDILESYDNSEGSDFFCSKRSPSGFSCRHSSLITDTGKLISEGHLYPVGILSTNAKIEAASNDKKGLIESVIAENQAFRSKMLQGSDYFEPDIRQRPVVGEQFTQNDFFAEDNRTRLFEENDSRKMHSLESMQSVQQDLTEKRSTGKYEENKSDFKRPPTKRGRGQFKAPNFEDDSNDFGGRRRTIDETRGRRRRPKNKKPANEA